jgi:hypothetical protein
MAESQLPPLKAMDEGDAKDHDASKETYKSFKYALPTSTSRRQEQFLGQCTVHVEPVFAIIPIIAFTLG